jgi:transcriptional regulator with XRE-family HTH domain
MEYEIWCRCLRQYRREILGWTQQDVAGVLRISRSHYSAIEHGRTVVNYRQLYNLAKTFGLKLEELLTFHELKGRKGKSLLPRA